VRFHPESLMFAPPQINSQPQIPMPQSQLMSQHLPNISVDQHYQSGSAHTGAARASVSSSSGTSSLTRPVDAGVQTDPSLSVAQGPGHVVSGLPLSTPPTFTRNVGTASAEESLYVPGCVYRVNDGCDGCSTELLSDFKRRNKTSAFVLLNSCGHKFCVGCFARSMDFSHWPLRSAAAHAHGVSVPLALIQTLSASGNSQLPVAAASSGFYSSSHRAPQCLLPCGRELLPALDVRSNNVQLKTQNVPVFDPAVSGAPRMAVQIQLALFNQKEFPVLILHST